MKYKTAAELIKMRDDMPVNELRRQTTETKKRDGYVSYRGIFETMGYKHVFNNTYLKTSK